MSFKYLVFVIVALVVLNASPVFACYGDAGGGPAFSIVAQPMVYAQAVQAPVYAQAVQADVGCVQQQAVVAYQQPLVQAVVGGYGYGGSQAIVVRRNVFRDRVIVPRRRSDIRVRVRG